MTPASTSTAPGLATATALFFTWSALTFLVRLWVKLRRKDNWGYDDSVVSVSMLFALFQLIAVFVAVDGAHYGLPWSDLSDSDVAGAQKSLYAAQICYCVSIGLSKVATALFIARMTRDTRNVRVAHGLAGICAAWTIGSVLAITIRGDLSHPWTIISGQQLLFVRWLGIEISGLLVELLLWGFAIMLIWGLHMQLSQRLIIVSIFSCRLGLIPLVAGRLYLLAPAQNPDPNKPALLAGVLSQAVVEFAFMSASVTCLRPFLRPFHSGFVVTSSNQSKGYATTSAAKEKYYALSSVRGANKDGTLQTANTQVSVGSGSDRAITGEGRGNFSNANSSARHQNFSTLHTRSSSRGQDSVRRGDRSDGRSHASSGSDALIISKTQAWTVSYEDGRDSREDGV